MQVEGEIERRDRMCECSAPRKLSRLVRQREEHALSHHDKREEVHTNTNNVHWVLLFLM